MPTRWPRVLWSCSDSGSHRFSKSPAFGGSRAFGFSRLWREEGAKCYEQWLDDAQANWPIPDERMKKHRQHNVPLCEQALKVLDDMRV
jgi:hypothetical protein